MDYLGGGSAQIMGFPGGISGKESACRCRRYKRCRLDPWSERSPGEGNDNPLQYSCLENLWIEEPGRLQSMGSQRIGQD